MVRRILNRPLHRRRHVPAPGHEHCRAERGVTVVEFSFVALMLLTVVAGTVDYGRAWQSGMAINEATRTGRSARIIPTLMTPMPITPV